MKLFHSDNLVFFNNDMVTAEIQLLSAIKGNIEVFHTRNIHYSCGEKCCNLAEMTVTNFIYKTLAQVCATMMLKKEGISLEFLGKMALSMISNI